MADAAAGLGCRHNAHTYREYMYFYLSGPATTASAAIDLLLACFGQPNPAQAELDKQRKAILNELELFAGQRERRLRDLASRALYGEHGPGRPPLGVASDIARVSDGDLHWFAEQAARRSRITLITDGPQEAAGPCAVPRSGGRSRVTTAGQEASAQADTLAAPECYGPRTNVLLAADTGAVLLALIIPGPSYLLSSRETYALRLFHPAELARAREINRGTHVHDRETAVGRCLVAGLELMRRQQVGHDAELFELWGDIDAAEVTAVAGRTLRPELARAAVIGPAALTGLTGMELLPDAWRLA